MINIQKINKIMLDKLYSVGWTENRHTDKPLKYIDQMIRDGYTFFDYAYEIINNLEGIAFKFSNDERIKYGIKHYYGDIEFSVEHYGYGLLFNPKSLKTEYLENVIPLGAICGQVILMVGESKKIYADIGIQGHDVVGTDIEDFLNRCAY
ncbi:MAG: SUKH-3 domain-containing protein [Ruminococcus sp.]|nr:SUKH-3 domain-containing protein [Ruminococcus sp.]MCM1480897.1 SUKH-3 domain-containing protein [Muribaculaceae bacterium]